MIAGKLNKKVTIQSAVEVQSNTGEVTTTWVLLAVVWASVTPLVGNELYKLKSVDAKISVKIRIRYISGITTKMRILYGSRSLNILSIINIKEKNKELLIMCDEIL